MKKLFFMSLLGVLPASMAGQSAIDAYRLTQSDMKGTARFMSMGGAFGALGGDLSTLSQNPAGIGVYRSNELGFTLNLDCQNANSKSNLGNSVTQNQTHFLLNNIGGVATMRLNSEVMPNLNIGFSYNKGASFNARYRGGIGLQNSLSNYIAGVSNNEGLTVADVATANGFDPYNPNDGGYAAPWISILGYDSYLINPLGDPDSPHWTGQWGDKTSGTGNFDIETKGSVDEYNIAIGGNIADKLYWGMNFDIVNIDYTMNALWGEDLQNAEVDYYGNGPTLMDSKWNMRNYYHVNGSGFNYQIGLIFKPIQELRLGFAVHTPTWYELNESFLARTSFNYDGEQNGASTNDGYLGTNSMKLRSPWKFIASAATVLGSRFILSADYEFTGYNKMRFSEPSDGYYDDWGWDWGYYDMTPRAINDPYEYTNEDIKSYYRATNTLRVGAEFRVTPRFSVRAGYSFVSSPVKESVRDNKEIIYTSGTLPNYRLDDTTNYYTCGLGYKYQKFYIDLAYIYKHLSSEYHAYTPDPKSPSIPSPSAKLSLNNSQIVMSCGFRF